MKTKRKTAKKIKKIKGEVKMKIENWEPSKSFTWKEEHINFNTKYIFDEAWFEKVRTEDLTKFSNEELKELVFELSDVTSLFREAIYSLMEEKEIYDEDEITEAICDIYDKMNEIMIKESCNHRRPYARLCNGKNLKFLWEDEYKNERGDDNEINMD